MKLTWREQTDGSWHARHYPRGAEWLSPFALSVWREDSVFPWHWEVRRHDEVLHNGQATEDEAARIAAHGQLMRQLSV